MGRTASSEGTLMKRLALIPWLLIVMLPGCIDRHRVNQDCDWTGDIAFPIDSHNTGHQQHLVADAQLAEELAIRYADAEHGRRFGYSGHGGLIEGGRVRTDCMARLVSAIQINHGVTPEQVHASRAQRDWRFDLAVAALFFPLYWYGSTVVSRVLARRFSSDRPAVRATATGFTSLIVSFLGLQVGQLWSGVWETIRVGNGHISGFRMASLEHPRGDHLVLLFLGAALLFCAIAWSLRRTPPALPAVVAMLAWTVLSVAFVATFVQHAPGYAFAALVVVAINAGLWFAGRVGAVNDAPASSAGLLGS